MIIDETPAFWVLNKPDGIAVNDEGNVSGFISQFNSTHGVRAHPVHRLDKGTSGLLLVAKHERANKALSNAFQCHQIKKRYIAVIRPKPGVKPKKKQGWIKGDMEKSRNGSWKLRCTYENPAITHFESYPLGERRRLCVLAPKTGKTHQLRVAMRSLSAPIVGDERYGGEPSDRMYLHAAGLRFTYDGHIYQYAVTPSNGQLFGASLVATGSGGLSISKLIDWAD